MTNDGTLVSIIRQLFGVSTSPLINSLTSTVGATAQRIVATHPRRVGLTFVNNSLNAIYISPFPDVAATRGIYLAPSGGSCALRYDIDFEMVSNEWYGIAGAGGSNITILENIASL